MVLPLLIALAGCMSAPHAIVPNDFKKIIITNKGSDDNYKASMLWFVENYNSAKDVIQYADKDSGIISGRGETNIAYKNEYKMDVMIRMDYVITIEIKDQSSKISFSDISVIRNSGWTNYRQTDYTLSQEEADAYLDFANNTAKEYGQFVNNVNFEW